MNKRQRKKAKTRDKESAIRMQAIRQSNASGVHEDQRKGYSKKDRSRNRQEERNPDTEGNQ